MITTWVAIFLGLVIGSDGYALTNQENSNLQATCGRYVPVANSLSATAEYKSLYGTLVGASQAPWVVSIALRNGRQVEPHGTGTIISPYHILTSAHLLGANNVDCSTGRIDGYAHLPPDFVVYLNVSCATPSICTDARRHESFAPLKVKKAYYPTGYKGDKCRNYESYHDIAIFELEKPIKFSPVAYPACLPQSRAALSIGVDKNLKIVGYGQDPAEKKLPRSGILKELYSDVSSCIDVGDMVMGDVFCTKARNTGLACAGDSGSGLVRNRNGRPTVEVVGVLSAGISCPDLLQTQTDQKRRNEQVSVSTDVLVSVQSNLDFMCSSSGVCPLAAIRSKRSSAFSGKGDFVVLE